MMRFEMMKFIDTGNAKEKIKAYEEWKYDWMFFVVAWYYIVIEPWGPALDLVNLT